MLGERGLWAVLSITFAVLLSGCLAHMSATNAADKLNGDAQREGSPYRWYVVDHGDKGVSLEPRLIGQVAQSKVPDSAQQKILTPIEELETKMGRTVKPQLKEIRILADGKSKVLEAWIFNSSGKEIAYTIEHAFGTGDQEFRIRGPWGKRF